MTTQTLHDARDAQRAGGSIRLTRRPAATALAALLGGIGGRLGAASPALGAPLASTTGVRQATLLEPNQKTPEISTEELAQHLAAGSAFVFDARPHLEWAISHIPGALNVAPKPGVPMSQYVSDVAEIGRVVPHKAAPIVLYCNGPFCGKSKRLGEELVAADYTNTSRYQLGAPMWRTLVGLMEIEPDGMRYVWESDRTAVWFDARTADEFAAGSLPGARHLPKAEVGKAKDDGRLPMDDHNARIVVFGADGAQAAAVGEEIAKNAFHNVTYFAGAFNDVHAALGRAV